MNTRNIQWICLAVVFQSMPVSAQITARDAVKSMRMGINLGNTLDAPPGETSWGNPLTEERYFDEYENAGFTAVRIPVTWREHMQTTAPWMVDADFMDRVEEIVDWGLERDLFIVINLMHEGWIKEDYTGQLARFDALWEQISFRFKDKSYRLLFEILNEPHPLTDLMQMDDLNRRAVDIIRNSGGNNDRRIIVFSGADWSGAADLAESKVPSTDTTYLIGNFHSYNVDTWTRIQDADGNTIGGTWNHDWNATTVRFEAAKAWADENNIAVMVNEWGSNWNYNYDDRMDFFACYMNHIHEYGFGGFVWDDGGSMRIFDRKNGGIFVRDVKDVITQPVFRAEGLKASAWAYAQGVRRIDNTLSPDSNSNYFVGDISDGDWVQYRLSIPAAGTYDLQLRVASPVDTGVLKIQEAEGGMELATIPIPNTGTWRTFTTIEQRIDLPAGLMLLELFAQKGGFNINQLKLIPVAVDADTGNSVDSDRVPDTETGNTIATDSDLNDNDGSDSHAAIDVDADSDGGVDINSGDSETDSGSDEETDVIYGSATDIGSDGCQCDVTGSRDRNAGILALLNALLR